MIESSLRKKITSSSMSLEKFGIFDLAWNKQEAVEMINSIETERIGILGGDVYRLNQLLEPLHDNWFSEPHKGETTTQYFARSKNEAINYIKNYPIDENENIIFTIVFTEKLD